MARRFFAEVVAEARRRKLLSADHFTVDGTLLEAWASLKSVHPKDEQDPPGPGGKNPSVDLHGERRTNETHASRTDPEAQLARKGKGKEARLCFAGHVLMENRNGLVVDVAVTRATGTAERETALELLSRVGGSHRITVGADKGYDTEAFVEQCRGRRVTPHVARKTWTAVDGRTTRHAGYVVSQRVRKRVEEVFGWLKPVLSSVEGTVGGGRKLRYRGAARNGLWAELAAAAYNLMRMAKLALQAA